MSKKEITAKDLLVNKGFLPVKWCGKYEADKVSMDTYDVTPGGTGMYGLVFDNTFSKQTSKMATFVALTYPTGSAPQSTNNLRNLQAKAGESQSSIGKVPQIGTEGDAAASVDSFNSNPRIRAVSLSNRSDGTSSLSTHVGSLSKRRRKKGQGYARRFFSLDYNSCTLSYYYNRNSSALRGAIPLSLAAIAADERRREISIDSGAEVWHLRAPNAKEFQEWARALEKASRIARGLEVIPVTTTKTAAKRVSRIPGSVAAASQDEAAEWQQVETLVSRVVGTRDALRRLTKEVAALPRPPSSSMHLSPGSAPHNEDSDGYFPAPEKKSFWRRKSSAPTLTPSALQQSAVSALAVPSPGSATATASQSNGTSIAAKRRSRGIIQEECSLHDHCQALLSDLDSVLAEFSTLIGTSKRRRLPAPVSGGADLSRLSIDSASSVDEFFDAEDAQSRVVRIGASDDESDASDHDDAVSIGNSSISSVGSEDAVGPDGTNHLFPVKAKNLAPLPIPGSVRRRKTIPPATVMPPSLIAFVRKNVGKDLSTISMPVSANEPSSFLQKVAEQMEYAQLLGEAAKKTSVVERLLYVTAFAVSQFSSNRAKERAIRKPFNPLLGETFELVRSEDETPGGFRLLVEKVQHRPVKLALHAEAESWTLAQSPAPGQKFWGKSAEITTDGRVRVVLRLPEGRDELYSWNIATMFLRNVVMGEKYVEPVGTMNIINDSTGHKASVEFRAKGMFGGRSEEVHVETYGPDGIDTGSGMTGTWTGSLKATGKAGSSTIWKAGSLVDNAATTYGMTTFAAGLNEITEAEKGKLPCTDSRLRPDQRMAENGKLDDAEAWKHKLEEAQRTRRRQLEESGGEHVPRWFTKIEDSPDGDEVWKIKTGKDSYWEERSRGAWTGLIDIFEANA